MTTDPRGRRPNRTGSARLRVRARWAVAGATVTALVAGCGGAAPTHQYVASADRSIVVKLPATWKPVDPTELGYNKPTASQWIAFYDGSGKGNPADFMSKLPISAPTAPVLQLVTAKRTTDGEVSLDELRDALTPSTPHEVVKFAKRASLDDAPVAGYDTSEEIVDTATAKGVRIRSRFEFDISNMAATSLKTQAPTRPPVSVVVDKLAVADKVGKHVHVIQIWCTRLCFLENQAQIDQIMSSYTVKSTP